MDVVYLDVSMTNHPAEYEAYKKWVSNGSVGPNTLDTLPQELLCLIAEYAGVRSVYLLFSASKKWKALVRHFSCLWRGLSGSTELFGLLKEIDVKVDLSAALDLYRQGPANHFPEICQLVKRWIRAEGEKSVLVLAIASGKQPEASDAAARLQLPLAAAALASKPYDWRAFISGLLVTGCSFDVLLGVLLVCRYNPGFWIENTCLNRLLRVVTTVDQALQCIPLLYPTISEQTPNCRLEFARFVPPDVHGLLRIAKVFGPFSAPFSLRNRIGTLVNTRALALEAAAYVFSRRSGRLDPPPAGFGWSIPAEDREAVTNACINACISRMWRIEE
mmetsp:Transcript_14237/g.33229  ORF Transcript_14237/g.33229 Transcript_14237/m.33229 type:complete len:332 (+) Transcript_14237:53-1048(+)